MEWLVGIMLVYLAVTNYIDMKKAKAINETLAEYQRVLEGFVNALDRASRDKPMIIASGKNAMDIAVQMHKAMGDDGKTKAVIDFVEKPGGEQDRESKG